MRIFKHFMLMAITSVSTICCQTGPKEVPSDITDKYIGKYLCKSITLMEGAVAIREGFEASADLYSQFTDPAWGGSPFNGSLNSYMIISPVIDYDYDMWFSMRIPLQDITYYKIDGYRPAGTYYCEQPSGNSTSLTFAYNVDQSGKVNFKIVYDAEMFLYCVEDNRTIEHLDCKYVEAKSIETDGKGTIKAVIHSAFYDYSSGQLVEGDVEYVYERVSYML